MADASLEPIEYPDPVVVAFMAHARALMAEQRGSIDPGQPDVPEQGPEQGSEAVVGRALIGLIGWSARAMVLRTSTVLCVSKHAMAAYRAFWSEIHARQWSPEVLFEIERSLRAVRLRATDVGRSHRYSRWLAKVIPPAAIGWPEGESRLDHDD